MLLYSCCRGRDRRRGAKCLQGHTTTKRQSGTWTPVSLNSRPLIYWVCFYKISYLSSYWCHLSSAGPILSFIWGSSSHFCLPPLSPDTQPKETVLYQGWLYHFSCSKVPHLQTFTLWPNIQAPHPGARLSCPSLHMLYSPANLDSLFFLTCPGLGASMPPIHLKIPFNLWVWKIHSFF